MYTILANSKDAVISYKGSDAATDPDVSISGFAIAYVYYTHSKTNPDYDEITTAYFTGSLLDGGFKSKTTLLYKPETTPAGHPSVTLSWPEGGNANGTMVIS